MDEENKPVYQVIADRIDLVTIPIPEYRELIEASIGNKTRAESLLHDWAVEKKRADDLAAEVEKLAAGADSLRKQIDQLKAIPF